MGPTTLALRLFPEPPAAATSATSATAPPPALHDVRACLATAQRLGCGAFGHVRLRAPGRQDCFLPAHLVPCPALSDGRGDGAVLLAADEGVLAALGVAVGGQVEVEAAVPLEAEQAASSITLVPLEGWSSFPPPALPAAVLNRAARGLLLAPGALLMVSHLGLTYALRVEETTAGGDAVLAGPETVIYVRAGPHNADGEAASSAEQARVKEDADIHAGVLEEAAALLMASSAAATVDPAAAPASLTSLRMRGLLLTGPRGAGKTQLLRRLVQRLRRDGVRAAYARGEAVRGVLLAEGDDEGGGQATGASVASRLAQQLWADGEREREEGRPAILVLDDADALLLGDEMDEKGGGNDDDEEGSISPLGRNSALRALRRYLLEDAEGPCCWILATRGSVGQGGSSGDGSGGGSSRVLARRLAALQGVGLFDRALQLSPLSEAERAAVLRALLPAVEVEEALVARVAEATGGFLPGDLERLRRAAALHAMGRQQPGQEDPQASEPQAPALQWADFAEARREVGPAALGGMLEASRARQQLQELQVSWASVGGYAEVKARLQQLIEWPLRYAATFERMGLGAGTGGKTPGILLHGPSGCGKSLLARVLAAEAKANFVELPATEVFSPFLGDSEARLRATFARARRASPCILFLDELDAMAAGREGMTADGGGSGGSSSGGVYARVLSTLLNEMDGVSTEAGGGGLVVLAATNRVEAVDAALLRPGRLQEAILVPLPRPEADYLPILQVATARMPLAPDVDFATLVRDRLAPLAAANGAVRVTPATLGALAREAALVCLREAVKARAGQEEAEERLEVTARHFERAIDIVLCT